MCRRFQPASGLFTLVLVSISLAGVRADCQPAELRASFTLPSEVTGIVAKRSGTRQSAASLPEDSGDSIAAINDIDAVGPLIDEIAAQCSGRDDTAALASAIKAGDGKLVVIGSGQTCVAGNLTIPNLRIEKGGLLKAENSRTILLSGNVEAGPYQIFANALPGQGTILFHEAPVTGGGQTGVVQAYPQWWGCVADYSHDCAPAMTAAINSGVRRVFLPGGGYGLASPVIIRNNNFVLEGQSRVFTDIIPLATDIHVGSGPNAMFINSENITNCIIEKIRFTSLIRFGGWTIWAEDGVQGGEALFSTLIQDCWISMGIAAPGFFHGAFSGSSFLNNEIENTQTVFDLKGGGISESLFINNRLNFSVGSFISSISTASNQMVVQGLQVSSHKRGVILDVKNGTDWQVSNVSLEYNGGDYEGGLANFDSCTKVILTNFKANRLSGNMSGILLKDSEARISNGYLFDVNGTATNPYSITIRGRDNDIDFSNVSVDTSGKAQVYFDANCGGAVRFSHCKFNRGASSIFDAGRGVAANIDIRDSTIINGQYNSKGSTASLIQLSSTGRVSVIDNVIGVDDVRSTPSAHFALSGSGEVLIDGNTFIGTRTAPVFSGSGTQVVRMGRNYGYASTFYAGAMPTTGSWTAGDIVYATAPVEVGVKGSKYIITGWIRLTSGNSNVLNTDWAQMRVATGN